MKRVWKEKDKKERNPSSLLEHLLYLLERKRRLLLKILSFSFIPSLFLCCHLSSHSLIFLFLFEPESKRKPQRLFWFRQILWRGISVVSSSVLYWLYHSTQKNMTFIWKDVHSRTHNWNTGDTDTKHAFKGQDAGVDNHYKGMVLVFLSASDSFLFSLFMSIN